MKGFARVIAVAMVVVALIVSCDKEKPTGTITFDSPALYFEAGTTLTIGYTLSNIDAGSVSVTTKPEGWSAVEINIQAQTVTITAPTEFNDDVVKSGQIVLNGKPKGGTVASASLFVGVNTTTDLSEKHANSYLLSTPTTNFTFGAMLKGDGRTEVATTRLAVIWQSPSGLIQHLDFKQGKGSFFVGADSKDATKIKQGNALIGAYDAAGTLVWSWHMWAADYSLDGEGGTVDLGGYTFMTRNLGALNNANTTQEEILASQGLYYQWGRREPFIFASTFDSTESNSAAMYDGSNTRVRLKLEASTAETGTLAYATSHPLIFITTTNKDADWLWDGDKDFAGTSRWGGVKTLYDPCPAGWQVAPAAAFDGLSLDAVASGQNLSDYADKYGWVLTDGTAKSLFIAAGRRSYRDGVIQNHFDESMPSRATEMQPWAGYYWSSSADQGLSSSFTFWFRKGTSDTDASDGGLRLRGMGRANGMSVRCVKIK